MLLVIKIQIVQAQNPFNIFQSSKDDMYELLMMSQMVLGDKKKWFSSVWLGEKMVQEKWLLPSSFGGGWLTGMFLHVAIFCKGRIVAII